MDRVRRTALIGLIILTNNIINGFFADGNADFLSLSDHHDGQPISLQRVLRDAGHTSSQHTLLPSMENKIVTHVERDGRGEDGYTVKQGEIIGLVSIPTKIQGKQDATTVILTTSPNNKEARDEDKPNNVQTQQSQETTSQRGEHKVLTLHLEDQFGRNVEDEDTAKQLSPSEAQKEDREDKGGGQHQESDDADWAQQQMEDLDVPLFVVGVSREETAEGPILRVVLESRAQESEGQQRNLQIENNQTETNSTSVGISNKDENTDLDPLAIVANIEGKQNTKPVAVDSVSNQVLVNEHQDTEKPPLSALLEAQERHNEKQGSLTPVVRSKEESDPSLAAVEDTGRTSSVTFNSSETLGSLRNDTEQHCHSHNTTEEIPELQHVISSSFTNDTKRFVLHSGSEKEIDKVHQETKSSIGNSKNNCPHAHNTNNNNANEEEQHQERNINSSSTKDGGKPCLGHLTNTKTARYHEQHPGTASTNNTEEHLGTDRMTNVEKHNAEHSNLSAVVTDTSKHYTLDSLADTHVGDAQGTNQRAKRSVQSSLHAVDTDTNKHSTLDSLADDTHVIGSQGTSQRAKRSVHAHTAGKMSDKSDSNRRINKHSVQKVQNAIKLNVNLQQNNSSKHKVSYQEHFIRNQKHIKHNGHKDKKPSFGNRKTLLRKRQKRQMDLKKHFNRSSFEIKLIQGIKMEQRKVKSLSNIHKMKGSKGTGRINEKMGDRKEGNLHHPHSRSAVKRWAKQLKPLM